MNDQRDDDEQREPAPTPRASAPPLRKQALNLSMAAAQALGAAVQGQPVKATPQQAKARIEVCRQCPHFVAQSERCLACGCFVQAKIKLTTSRCPVGRWD